MQKTYYFIGKAYWSKFKEPDPKFNKFTLDFYPNEGSMQAFKASGAQLQIREGEEGEYVKFSRPVQKLIKGDLINLGPPRVLIRKEDGEYAEFEGLVGNGSLVTCKVIVFDTQRGKGHTLEAVSVEHLVPYEPNSNRDTTTGEIYPF